MVPISINLLTLPLPSFAGPIEEKRPWVRRADCRLCGTTQAPCFRLGYGTEIRNRRGKHLGLINRPLAACYGCLRGESGLQIILSVWSGLRMRAAEPLRVLQPTQRRPRFRSSHRTRIRYCQTGTP